MKLSCILVVVVVCGSSKRTWVHEVYFEKGFTALLGVLLRERELLVIMRIVATVI
jgi:hypothetical protein